MSRAQAGPGGDDLRSAAEECPMTPSCPVGGHGVCLEPPARPPERSFTKRRVAQIRGWVLLGIPAVAAGIGLICYGAYLAFR